MALLPLSFEDQALTKYVAAITAYEAAQRAAWLVANPGGTAPQSVAAVGFAIERDRLTPPTDDELLAKPLVICGFESETQAQGGGKQKKRATARFFFDLYTAKLEPAGATITGDKAAQARLYYLKAQVEAACFDLAQLDLGFAPGVIAKKPFGSWQSVPITQDSEMWFVAGRWTFELDYEWAPDSPQGVALEEISVTTERWSALYTYEE